MPVNICRCLQMNLFQTAMNHAAGEAPHGRCVWVSTPWAGMTKARFGILCPHPGQLPQCHSLYKKLVSKHSLVYNGLFLFKANARKLDAFGLFYLLLEVISFGC